MNRDHSRNSIMIHGVEHVWSILDNAWIPLDFWKWVNKAASSGPDEYDREEDYWKYSGDGR